jgi:hypothetical protein
MYKTFTINFTVWKRNLVLHTPGLQNAPHKFFYNITAAKKCSSSNMKESFVFPSITFFMELVINCSESKDSASVGKTTSDSMKVT